MPRVFASYRPMPRLPSDVWSIILRSLVLSDGTFTLRSVSLISRSIGYEADRYLWGNLKVESSDALLTLTGMILGHARISLHLTRLCVQSPSQQRRITLTSIDGAQIQQALLRCSKLSALELWLGADDTETGFVQNLYIPPLRTFSTDLVVDPTVFAFLERHAGIQKLHLAGDVIIRTNTSAHMHLLPNLHVLEAPLPLAIMLLPCRPVSHLKVWASYGLSQDLAVAEALQLIACMRLSTAHIISFRFEDGPPYTPAIHHYGAGFSPHMRLLGLLFIDREEEDQALQLVQVAPSLRVIQLDNAMANRRTSSEQREFVLRLGYAFKSLQLVSFEDDYQNTHWERLKNNKWMRREGVPFDLWKCM